MPIQLEGEVKEEPKKVIGVGVNQTTCLWDTLKRPILGQILVASGSGHSSCQWVSCMSHENTEFFFISI